MSVDWQSKIDKVLGLCKGQFGGAPEPGVEWELEQISQRIVHYWQVESTAETEEEKRAAERELKILKSSARMLNAQQKFKGGVVWIELVAKIGSILVEAAI